VHACSGFNEQTCKYKFLNDLIFFELFVKIVIKQKSSGVWNYMFVDIVYNHWIYLVIWNYPPILCWEKIVYFFNIKIHYKWDINHIIIKFCAIEFEIPPKNMKFVIWLLWNLIIRSDKMHIISIEVRELLLWNLIIRSDKMHIISTKVREL